MTETDHPLDRLDAPNRILKRAQHEAMTFELFETDVLIRNESHANPTEHEYLVRIEDGLPVSCTCPADEYYDYACKHRVAVAIRRPIIDFANEAKLVTDGGAVGRTHCENESSEGIADDSSTVRDGTPDGDCDCTDLPDGVPCWDCYRAAEASFD